MTKTSHYLNFWIFLTLRLDVYSPSLILYLANLVTSYWTINFLFIKYFFYLKYATYRFHWIMSMVNLEKFWFFKFFIANLTFALINILRIFFYTLYNFKVLAKFYIFIALPSANGLEINFTKYILIRYFWRVFFNNYLCFS